MRPPIQYATPKTEEETEAMKNRPNILWICTDRQRWDTLGCNGNPYVTTPNIDRLAKEGVCFQQAFSQNPVCTPSRASFLTGRYPRATRLTRNGQTIPSDEKLISRLLADAGYLCGHAGKFHLSASSPEVMHWSEQRTDDGYVTFDWSMHPPATPVSQYTAWLHEHNIEFKRTPVEDGCPYVTFGMDKETSNTAWIAQRAINFMHCSKDTGRPWFFTCNIEDPHEPYDPPEEFLRPYLDKLDEIPLPKYEDGELENKPPFQATDRAGVYGQGTGNFAAEKMSDRDHRLLRAAYWAMVDHIDYQVGRMLEALEASGQRENTIVMFSCDHGDMLGDHGMYMQGPYFYDEMVRVPLIFSWPKAIRKNLSSQALVELTDLAPTLLDAAGLPRYGNMQGESFWPLLTGETDTHRDDVYYEYYQSIPGWSCHGSYGGAYITGIRNREYAITCVHNLDCGELYDLQNDPGMVHNLWDAPEHTPAKVRMLKRLCDRMAGTIDPLPEVRANY